MGYFILGLLIWCCAYIIGRAQGKKSTVKSEDRFLSQIVISKIDKETGKKSTVLVRNSVPYTPWEHSPWYCEEGGEYEFTISQVKIN